MTELASEAREQLLGTGKKEEGLEAERVAVGRSEDEDRVKALKGRAGRKPVAEDG